MRTALRYDPYEVLASHPELRLRVAPLDPDVAGCFDPDTRTIWLDSRLTQGERRATLSHELHHALRGDALTGVPCVDLAQERHAVAESARALISVDDLLDALLWSRDEHELAEMLWVDVETVRTRLAGLTPAEQRTLDERLFVLEEEWGSA